MGLRFYLVSLLILHLPFCLTLSEHMDISIHSLYACVICFLFMRRKEEEERRGFAVSPSLLQSLLLLLPPHVFSSIVVGVLLCYLSDRNMSTLPPVSLRCLSFLR